MVNTNRKKALIFGGAALTGLGAVLLFKKPVEAEEPPNGEPPPNGNGEPPPPPPSLANLYGVVSDAETGIPLSGVLVTANGLTTPTSGSGQYAFEGLTPGSYTLMFEKDGYVTKSDSLVLIEGSNELAIQLVPVAVPPPAEEEPPAFTGFSLMIENPMSGAAYWFADFPFSSYAEDIASIPVDEAGWITEPAPGRDTVRISFVDSSFQCPAGDPGCDGLLFDVLLENGHHYILDASTGELKENPIPPEPPEVSDEPHLVGANIPRVASDGDFYPAFDIYLPPTPSTRYSVFLTIPPDALPESGASQWGTIARYIEPSLQDAADYNYGVPDSGYTLPLDSQDNIYHTSGSWGLATIEEFEPVIASWEPLWAGYDVGRLFTRTPLPPGNYPLVITIIAERWLSGRIYTTVGTYDLGVVGRLVVT